VHAALADRVGEDARRDIVLVNQGEDAHVLSLGKSVPPAAVE
jgi:hypothetical protein